MTQISVKRSFASLGNNDNSNPFSNFEATCSPHRISFLTSPNSEPNPLKRQHTLPPPPINGKRRFEGMQISHETKEETSTPSPFSSSTPFTSPSPSPFGGSFSFSSFAPFSSSSMFATSFGPSFNGVPSFSAPTVAPSSPTASDTSMATDYVPVNKAPLKRHCAKHVPALPSTTENDDDESKSRFLAVPPMKLADLASTTKKKFTRAEVEDLLAEQQTMLRELYENILMTQLREQFENFSKFNQDYVTRQMNKNDLSYCN